MMKHILTLLAFLPVFGVFGQQTTLHSTGKELIETAVKENKTVGIVAGFSKGDIQWQQAAGYSDLKNQIAFDTTTITRIASISKPMTAIAIMQLFEEGKLDLNESIQTYIPSFPTKQEGEITVKQLLQHTAGIGAYKNNREQQNTVNYPTLSHAVELFKDRELLAVPGQKFNYTTYGYVVLGLIIEKVSGMSYEAYMQANIWDKANMTHTGIEKADTPVDNQSLTYHKSSNGKIKPTKPTNLSDRVPGGGIYSTVTDMLKFGDAVLNNSLIQASTFEMMTQNPGIKTQGSGYGMGWYLYGKNPKYGNVFGHTGAQTGASAFLMLLPEVKTSIIVLSNTSGAIQTVSDITVKLFDIAHEAGK